MSAVFEPQIKTRLDALKLFFERDIAIFWSGLDLLLIFKIVKG